jgi:hypothetical protein
MRGAGACLGAVLGAAFAAGSLGQGCREPVQAPSAPLPAAPPRADLALGRGLRSFTIGNRFAYIPPQCYVRTHGTHSAYGGPRNPCFVCHLHADPPNFANDEDLPASPLFPPGALDNRWTHEFDPAALRADAASDDDVLAYVRQSNYFDERGGLALAATIDELAKERPNVGFRGFRPDAWFSFDQDGFDRRPDGSYTGWRAFAYYPFPGAFFPTNGSMDDVLVRLDPIFQEDAEGRFDARVYAANLEIVLADARGSGEALPYVGRAGRAEPNARLPRAAGLFPRGTEFLHSVRYLDVDESGAVVLAARMKELRYARKEQWFSASELRQRSALESVEQARSVDGAVPHAWQFDRGISNGQGWLFQGYIEDADGALRPQSFEESLTCAGCHGGIGATTDSIFSFPRKLGREGEPSARAQGWFHANGPELRGVPEPRARDGAYEYTEYLARSGGADDFRDNEEVARRFFDEDGRIIERAAARLHEDVAYLLTPSRDRALALDRAAWAIAREQSFDRGRDSVLSPRTNVYAHVPPDAAATYGDAFGPVPVARARGARDGH